MSIAVSVVAVTVEDAAESRRSSEVGLAEASRLADAGPSAVVGRPVAVWGLREAGGPAEVPGRADLREGMELKVRAADASISELRVGWSVARWKDPLASSGGEASAVFEEEADASHGSAVAGRGGSLGLFDATVPTDCSRTWCAFALSRNAPAYRLDHSSEPARPRSL